MATLLPITAAILLVVQLASLPVHAQQKEYVVETLVFVDKLANTTWSKNVGRGPHVAFDTEVESLMNEVNEIYKSLDSDYGLKVTFKVIGIIYNLQILSASVHGNIEAISASSMFQQYLSYRPEYQYDVALLLTGSNLEVAIPSDLKGVAEIASVCRRNAVAITQIRGTYTNVLVTAHELAHVLGAHHEGLGEATSCSKEPKYLMTASDLTGANRYKFSSCAHQSIKRTLQQVTCVGTPSKDACKDKTETCADYGKDICTNTPAWAFANCRQYCGLCVQDHSVPRFGQLMSADDVCRRSKGSTAYASRDRSSYGDSVCLKLDCVYTYWKTKKSTVVSVPSPDGMVCGKSKQCVKGKCVAAATPSVGVSRVSDVCPFGDQPVLEGTKGVEACGLLTQEQCKKPGYQRRCCFTCNQDRNSEYGRSADDACRKLEGAGSQLSRQYYKKGYDHVCSKLACLKFPLDKFKVNVYKAPDGMMCANNHRCSNGECKSVSSTLPVSDTCPFGDQPWIGGKYRKYCPDIIWRSGCKNWDHVCCGTCLK